MSSASVSHAVPAPRTSVRLALFALRFYKTYLSILMGGTCRFEPTCSVYAYEAVERFGVRRGCWLALKRLLRCQPLSRKFGYDPVPQTWSSTEDESKAVPQGLKPEEHDCLMSDLKVRSTNLIKAETGYVPVQHEAHS